MSKEFSSHHDRVLSFKLESKYLVARYKKPNFRKYSMSRLQVRRLFLAPLEAVRVLKYTRRSMDYYGEFEHSFYEECFCVRSSDSLRIGCQFFTGADLISRIRRWAMRGYKKAKA
jgi:hypothetical protein